MLFFSLIGMIVIIVVVNILMDGCHTFFIFMADVFIGILFAIDYFGFPVQLFCK